MAEDNQYLDLGYGQGLEGWGITPGDIYQQRQAGLDEGKQTLLDMAMGMFLPYQKDRVDEEEEDTEKMRFRKAIEETEPPVSETDTLEDIVMGPQYDSTMVPESTGYDYSPFTDDIMDRFNNMIMSDNNKYINQYDTDGSDINPILLEALKNQGYIGER